MFSKDKTAYFFLIFATLFWSGNFIVGKAASFFEIPPFTLNFYRWTFAWIILAPFTLKEIFKKRKHILDNFKLMLTDLEAEVPRDILADLLHLILDEYNNIINPINRKDIINNIFAGFCVGK